MKERCALIEFKRSRDADEGYDRLEGREVDGRVWEVDYASKKDLAFFGWPTDEFDDDDRDGDRHKSGSGGQSPASG